jgi:uncharacterized protein with PIN domain
MTNDLRFLCDEMLVGLGRWLRIAGYDTAIAKRGCRDHDLVEQSHAEGRILLTRDRRLVEIRRANDRTIVLEGNDIDACAEELCRRLALDWTLDPLTRCTLCNTRLALANRRLLDVVEDCRVPNRVFYRLNPGLPDWARGVINHLGDSVIASHKFKQIGERLKDMPNRPQQRADFNGAEVDRKVSDAVSPERE